MLETKRWLPFSKWMKAQYTISTCENYTEKVERFFSETGIQDPDELKKLDAEGLIDYIEKLKKTGIDTHNHAYALINLLKFYGCHELANQVPTPRGQVTNLPKWLPEPVVQLLIDDYGPDDRMKALCSVSYDLALRAGEALMLNVGPSAPKKAWIDIGTSHANVFREKTKAYPWQSHQISSWTHGYLDTYVTGKEDEPLFLKKKNIGERMTYKSLQVEWNNWMKDLGLKEKMTHHVLRHSKLTWMAVEGKDAVDIMRFAGHQSLMATSIYLHMGTAYRNNALSTIEFLKDSKIYEEAKARLGI